MPETFGKYTLLRSLAKGGMGEVFLARAGQPGFERLFAVKRILTDHEGSESFGRMLRDEARISIKLQHPNIVQVFEFGEERGGFFLVMEYVEGLSLSALLRAGRDQGQKMLVADALWVTRELCRALDYAHRKADADGTALGIIHRDISPHNVLIDEAGSAKLIDFGIAKAAQNNVVTEAGALKGKIPYMAPEQAAGEGIDQRLDLYAVGTVLYECLAYERVFPKGSPMSTLAKVIRGEFPDFKEELPGLPKAVYDVLNGSITKDPDERFDTAGDMEAAVARALAAVEPAYTPRSLAEHLETVDLGRHQRKHQIAGYMSHEGAPVVEDVSEAATRSIKPDTGSGHESIQGIDISFTTDSGSGAAGGDGTGRPSGAPPTEAGTPATTLTPPPLLRTMASEGAMYRPEPDEEDVVPPGLGPGAKKGIAAGLAAMVVASLVAFVALGEQEAAAPVDAPSDPSDTAPPADDGDLAAPDPQPATPGDPNGSKPIDDATATGEPGPDGDDVGPDDGDASVDEPADDAKPAAIAKQKRRRRARRSRKADKTNDKPSSTTRPTTTRRTAKGGTGCVAVDASPWANIFVKGSKVGTTPLACLKLPAGTHTIELKNPALGRTERRRVKVTGGGRAKVFVSFK